MTGEIAERASLMPTFLPPNYDFVDVGGQNEIGGAEQACVVTETGAVVLGSLPLKAETTVEHSSDAHAELEEDSRVDGAVTEEVRQPFWRDIEARAIAFLENNAGKVLIFNTVIVACTPQGAEAQRVDTRSARTRMKDALFKRRGREVTRLREEGYALCRGYVPKGRDLILAMMLVSPDEEIDMAFEGIARERAW